MSYEQFSLRCDKALAAWLRDRASTNRRSMNSEILLILERVRDAEAQAGERAA